MVWIKKLLVRGVVRKAEIKKEVSSELNRGLESHRIRAGVLSEEKKNGQAFA